jgi:hypothetical protein
MDRETAVQFLLAISPKPSTFVCAASNFTDNSPNGTRFSELNMNTGQQAETLHPGNTSDIACHGQITNLDIDTIQQSERNNANHEVPHKRYESSVPFMLII